MAKFKCKISGCRDEHHAKGYCNRHYKKFARLGDPTAGKTYESGPRQQITPDHTKRAEPEKRKKPGSGQGNINFFLNQKFIEKLYNEALKARTEIVYKTANAHHIPHFLTMGLLLSGYDRAESELMKELIDELETWLNSRDKIRFMECLANWDKRAAAFDVKQPARNAQQLTLFK